MLQKVQKKMQERNMVLPKEKVLVGVSGGADSVGLLLVLAGLSKEMDFSLEAVHVEHGLRGQESLEDAEFVKDLCQTLGIVCHMQSVDVPDYAQEHSLGHEEAARKLRYEVFAKLAKEQGAKVALAHHMEDNAETILFQFIRGSHLAGLSGIRAVATHEDGITYIRPFLSLHKSEIVDFLQQRGIEYRTDSTNLELDYSRNYIRNKIMPKLAQINQQAVSHMHETGEYLGEMKDYLDKEVEQYWQQIASVTPQQGCEEGIVLNIPQMQSLHPVLQKELLYKAIGQVLGRKKDITATHVESLRSLMDGQSGKRISLPEGVIGQRDFDRLLLFRKREADLSEDSQEAFFKEITQEVLEQAYQTGETLEIPLGGPEEKLFLRVLQRAGNIGEIPKKSYTKWLDYDKIKQGFCIRNRCSGDYFISDAAGHHKSLKQYFIDQKISVEYRDKMWLLASEHLVLWLIGGRISQHLKVTEQTTTMVEIKYQGGNTNEC